jgi:HemY protein
MKKGIYVAIALLGGALLAQLLLADPGYVAVRFAGQLVEMSVVVLVLLLAGAYAAVRLMIRLFQARRLWREAQEQRRHDRARRALARGVLEMSEGNWHASEETLVRSAQHSEVPAAHLLVAARAAELQGAMARRNELLVRALEASPDKRAPVLILQAELHLKHGERAAARAVLEQLEASGEQTSRGLALLARVYEQEGDWQQLAALEPRLRKLIAGGPAAERAAANVYLQQLRAAKTASELASLWKSLPKVLARRPEVVTVYARAALTLGEHDAAEAELASALQRQWDESVVLVLGEVQSKAPLQTLERAEQWLAAHPQSAALLLSCGRLSVHAELFGKARSHLESSLALQPRLETYQLLADLLEQLGERERALAVCMEAITHALGSKRALPRLRTHRWLEPRRGEARRT